MNELSSIIKKGAQSFLNVEYIFLTLFCIIAGGALIALFSLADTGSDEFTGIRIGCAFFAGALMSGATGQIGMSVATSANVRTTQAASERIDKALRVAFTGGAVMGFSVVGLGVLGLSVSFLILTVTLDGTDEEIYTESMESLAGFGFGASSVALFSRVGGGIYTKAADVGADLVGKVENDIPEDDPRNPAVIADNVGDNVGDVAGMGSDLFESFVGSIIATATLARGEPVLVALPFVIAAIGIVSSLIGFFAVRTKPGATQTDLLRALLQGTGLAGIIILVGSAALLFGVYGGDGAAEAGALLGCIAAGLVAGILIGQFTEYFTSYAYGPTKSIAAASKTGPATVIIQGFGIGMISCLPTIVVLVFVIIGCDELAGEYGIALSAVGMLSTLGLTLATDAYGPIADNAGGIAEMAGLDPSVRGTTDTLDALGNTTAATGKGFAIGSGVLTALSLLAAFEEEAGLKDPTNPLAEPVDISIGEPIVLAGVIFGGMLPVLFSSLTMLSVQKAAGEIILEVRRQFKTIPGLLEGKEGAEPDTLKCVRIATSESIKEMILPGVYAVLTPIAVGFLVGPRMLIGTLAGSIIVGAMLAIIMANAGGAWDNSKKMIEIEGMYGGKGTDAHKATIVGDTVGDPFKDTSGPAIDIFFKLMSMVSLAIAPVLEEKEGADWEDFYLGFIPLGAMGLVTLAVYYFLWRGGTLEDKLAQQQF